MLTSNKRGIKYIIALFILALFITTTTSFAMVTPTNDFYVNDYANLLDEQTKQYIMKCNQDLYSKTGAQIVIVTVPNLEGESLEDYATKLFRNFGIGSKEKNNGVLLLLALKERQFRVEVGYGLEGALPDGKTGRIQDEYIIPYLKNDNWNDGVKNGFNAILQVVCEEYGIEISNSETPIVQEETEDTYSTTSTYYIYIVIIIVLIILTRGRILFIGGGRGGFSGGSGGGFSGGRRFLRRRRLFTVEEEALEVFKKK